MDPWLASNRSALLSSGEAVAVNVTVQNEIPAGIGMDAITWAYRIWASGLGYSSCYSPNKLHDWALLNTFFFLTDNKIKPR